jgi:hypothetical protein
MPDPAPVTIATLLMIWTSPDAICLIARRAGYVRPALL